MIITLPSDIAAYNAWAEACYTGTGGCGFDPVTDGFPDYDVIYTWGDQGDGNNNVYQIIFTDDPGGDNRGVVYVPITESFTVSSFTLALDTTTNISPEYDEIAFGVPLTEGMPAYGRGATAVWPNLNPDVVDYRSGEQLFTLEVARAAHPYNMTQVFDTLEGFQPNARGLIFGDPDRMFVTYAGPPESPTSASITQFVESTMLIPAGGSLTINPGDNLRITFFRSDLEDMSPADPHFVFGPISLIFDTPAAEFWTKFCKTTEQAE